MPSSSLHGHWAHMWCICKCAGKTLIYMKLKQIFKKKEERKGREMIEEDTSHQPLSAHTGTHIHTYITHTHTCIHHTYTYVQRIRRKDRYQERNWAMAFEAGYVARGGGGRTAVVCLPGIQ